MIIIEACAWALWLVSGQTNDKAHQIASKYHKIRKDALNRFAGIPVCQETYEYETGKNPDGPEYTKWAIRYRRKQTLYGIIALIGLIVSCMIPY